MPTLEQTDLGVSPTQSILRIRGRRSQTTAYFTTPLLPADLDLLSRPITYLTYEIQSTTAVSTVIQIFFAASAELAVNLPKQQVVYGREEVNGLTVQRIGSQQQAVLSTKGDDRRIDWGYLYLATPAEHVAFECFEY